jgi:hypothetical protein
MIDPVAAFIALLRTNATLVSAVQSRIYGSPPGLASTAYDSATGIPKASLTVQQAGGRTAQHIPVIYPLFYLVAYAPSGIDAHKVLLKVYDVLYHTDGVDKGKARCNIMISDRWFMYVADMQLGSPAVEQSTQWPVAYASVQTKFDSLRGA